MQVAANDSYFMGELEQHFPQRMPGLLQMRADAAEMLPRSLEEELHADRHHRAATLFEMVTRLGPPLEGRGWRYWLDELFLHPQYGLLGSLGVFALVLFVVFEVSVYLDSMTAAKLIDWLSGWQPASTGGVVLRAVTDGLIGLVGIVIPYMIPLVMLLVWLEDLDGDVIELGGRGAMTSMAIPCMRKICPRGSESRRKPVYVGPPCEMLAGAGQ